MANIYNAQLDAFSIYHKILEETAPSLLTGPTLPALGHGVAGSTGTALSNLVVFPLDLIITRLQVQRLLHRSGKGKEKAIGQDVEYRSILDAVWKIYDKDGVHAFYNGVVQDTVKSVADSFLFFLAYSFLRERRIRARSDTGAVVRSLPILDELSVGMLAGAFSKFFTTPISNIVTRKQVDTMLTSHECEPGKAPTDAEWSEIARTGRPPVARGSGKSVKDIARDIYEVKGVKGFWSGYSATLVLALNPAITFLLHNTLTHNLLPRSKRDAPGVRATFLLAAISKAIASTITYPFSLAKARSQVDGKYEEQKGRTVFGSLLVIFKEEGWRGLYDGVEGEVIKGFLANGLTMMLKEWIHRFVIQGYYIILKLLRRYLVLEVAGNAKEAVVNAGGSAKDAVVSASGSAKDAAINTGGQMKELAGNAGGSLTNASSQTKDTVTHMSSQARDALMDLGDEVEEVAAAMEDEASDAFWGVVETADGWRGRVIGFVKTRVVTGGGEGQGGGERGGEGK